MSELSNTYLKYINSSNSNINLSDKKRYDMFLEMCGLDYKMWNKEHHWFYIQSNLCISYLLIYTLYKYNLKRNEHFNFLQQKTNLKGMVLFGFISFFGLYQLNKILFNKYIYHFYYSKDVLPDLEFLDIYDEVNINKRINERI
jgi:hypothetical protein